MTSSSDNSIINPVLRGFAPDPSVCRVGNTVYMATSTFEWYPGVQIHASEDLVHWRQVAIPLNRASQLDMRGNPDSCGVWAPSLSYADGQFWLIYTDVKRLDGSYKDAHNYLVTASEVSGEWSDPVRMNSSGFDPSLFHDDDGRKWFVNMVWNHHGGRGGQPRPSASYFDGILLQEYDAEAQTLTGPITNIFSGSELGLTEAPHLFKRGDWYYLSTAEGGTGYQHAITLARSRQLQGPYELHPKTHLLTTRDATEHPLQRCGHGQYFELADGSAWFSFLCSRPLPGLQRSPMGRESGIARCRWDEQGWLHLDSAAGQMVPETRVEAPPLVTLLAESRQATTGAPVAASTERTEFSEESLPLCFQWLRSPEPERLFSLQARPGYLRLFGRESIGSWFEQSLVARRQREWKYRADTVVEFNPDDFQQAAGLVTYYNRTQFHYLAITAAAVTGRSADGLLSDGKREPSTARAGRRLTIMSCTNWPEGRLEFPLDTDIPLPANGPVWLGVDVDGAEQQFRYSLDGSSWTSAGPVLDASLLSDEGVRGEHSNFTGNYVGMCAQDTSGRAAVADFAWFEMQSFAPAGESTVPDSSR